MKILLFGASGRIGWELQRSLQPLGELVALDHRRSGPFEADITRHEGVAKTVREVGPGVIVNAAAFTSVDLAEGDPAAAFKINAESPAALAHIAREAGAWLVHFSTDYVFDGVSPDPYTENSPAHPMSVYGRSKLAGDQGIQASGCQHLILRPSWLYCARRPSFLSWVIDTAMAESTLTAVYDHVGAPTSAELVADVTAHALHTVLRQPARDSDHAGIYNVAAAGSTNWHDYADVILDWARRNDLPVKVGHDGIVPIASADLRRPARRPPSSRMSTRKLCETFGLSMPNWRYGVERVLEARYGAHTRSIQSAEAS